MDKVVEEGIRVVGATRPATLLEPRNPLYLRLGQRIEQRILSGIAATVKALLLVNGKLTAEAI